MSFIPGFAHDGIVTVNRVILKEGYTVDGSKTTTRRWSHLPSAHGSISSTSLRIGITLDIGGSPCSNWEEFLREIGSRVNGCGQ